MVPLLLAASAAHALPAQTSMCDALVVPPGAREACWCVFDAQEDDWVDPFVPSDVAGSCYEYTRVVNPVQAFHRADVLRYMNKVGWTYACGADPDRKFTYTHTTVNGYVWITGQLLETMSENSCNIGDGPSNQRQAWFDRAKGVWLVLSAKGDTLAMVEEVAGDSIQRVWQFSPEDPEELEELVVRWTSGRIWSVIGPLSPDDVVTAPEE